MQQHVKHLEASCQRIAALVTIPSCHWFPFVGTHSFHSKWSVKVCGRALHIAHLKARFQHIFILFNNQHSASLIKGVPTMCGWAWHTAHLKVSCQHIIVLLNNLVEHLVLVLLGLLLHVLGDVAVLKLGTQLLACKRTTAKEQQH